MLSHKISYNVKRIHLVRFPVHHQRNAERREKADGDPPALRGSLRLTHRSDADRRHPFFQEYLSLFNPDRELEGLTLWTKDDDDKGGKKPLFNGQEPSADDYKMLQLLIISSFSNRYGIIPGPQPATYRLGFQTLKHPNIYAVDQLFNFQIKGLYPAYIGEQMRLEVLLSSDERDQVWQQRTERLSLFQEKVVKLRGMLEKTPDSPQT